MADGITEVNETNAAPETKAPENFELNNTPEAKTEEVAAKETGPGFFSKVFTSMFGDKDDNPAEDIQPVPTTPDDDVLEVEADLYDAAKAKGWDDDKIAKYYKEDKSVLEALVGSPEKPAEKVETKTESNKPELEPLSVDAASMKTMKDQYGDEVVDQVIAPLLTKLNQTIEIVNRQSNENKVVAEAVSRQTTTQRLGDFQEQMDQLGEQYEVFGKWENVPQTKDGQIDVNHPMFKSRDEVWRMAQAFNRTGSDWKTAVADAVSLYKGKNLETMIQAKIIKELNSRKVKFTPRPTSKKVEAAPLSGDAAKRAVIRQGLKTIGKD